MNRTKILLFLTTVLLLLGLAACELPAPGSQQPPATNTPVPPLLGVPTQAIILPSPTPLPIASPTPTIDPALLVPSATPPPAPAATAVPAPDTSSPTGETIHTVAAGENLFRIGLRYGFTVQELATYNGIANPNMLSVGQQIRIPPK